MNYAVLGSGSSANSYLLWKNDFALLVDNGYSAKRCLERVVQTGVNPRHIRFIFVTHTHGDHYKGVASLAERLNIPVVAHASLALPECGHKLNVQPGRHYKHGPLGFFPFLTNHDSPWSLGFSFVMEGRRLTFITDTGKVLPEWKTWAARSHVLFLESNYDEEMLRQGPYPPHLKRRIASVRGHLSNRQARDFLEALKEEDSFLERVYFCHLSEKNNTPEKVKEEMTRGRFAFDWTVCPHGEWLCPGAMSAAVP